MLTFFKKLRRKLLIEGKLKNYAIYALGEIILVVIGILIALQINNWNMNRLAVIEVENYKIALQNDLVQDTLRIQRFIDLSEEEHRISSNMDSRFFMEGVTIDTVMQLANEFFPGEANNGILTFNTATYQALTSTGTIGLMPADLQLLILKHYQLLNELLEYQNKQIDDYFAAIMNFGMKYKFGFGSRFNVNLSQYLSDLYWRIDDEREYVLLFSTMNGLRTFLMSEYITRYKAALQSSKALIAAIDAS